MTPEKRWRLKNPEKWRVIRDAATARWRKANHHRNMKVTLARQRKNELKKINRVPVWANLDAIREFYVNCPQRHQVDHIIPLKHPLVSGLHVLHNLQYLPTLVNQEKGNNFLPTD